MSEIDKLLAEIGEKTEALAKAQAAPADEPEPKAEEKAAEEKAADAEPKADAADAEEKAADADAEAGKAAEGDVAKSFKVKDADGREMEAVDGFAMLKAMEARIDALVASLDEVKSARPAEAGEAVAKSFADAQALADTRTETLAKGIAAVMAQAAEGRAAQDALAKGINDRFAAQEGVLKSLADAVEKLGASGSGRRSTVAVNERPSAVAKAEAAPTVGEVFAKTNALIAAGKLTGFDAGRITASVNGNRGIPAEYAALFAA